MGVGSGVEAGVSSGVDSGVDSGVGAGVGSRVGSGIDSGVCNNAMRDSGSAGTGVALANSLQKLVSYTQLQGALLDPTTFVILVNIRGSEFESGST